MSRVLESIAAQAQRRPERIALEDETGALTYGELDAVIRACARTLEEDARVQTIALLAGNSRSWVVADLAALRSGARIVPLPPYMSPRQIEHALRSAGVDMVLTDDPQCVPHALRDASSPTEAFHGDVVQVRLVARESTSCVPAGTWKITFTSGTTGEPKGVCLGIDELENTASAVCTSSAASEEDRHLCVLPLATLLENVGAYAAFLAAATACVPALHTVGLSGSSGLDAPRLVHAFSHWKATSAILVPQMALAIVAACRAGAPVPRTLRSLAVGGAPVSPTLLAAARALGLPLYEGYGLSECASVVAVNRPSADRIGSVGQPLPHVTLAFAADGEILIGGIRWLGYLDGGGAAPHAGEWIATGDLGCMDEDGYLHVTGRKKNIFITSFGRNVAPEWVERELVSKPAIAQAAIFGEARPFNTAVIVPRRDASQDSIAQALEAANEDLPDYARIGAWIAASEPFSIANGLATPNGRLRRRAIYEAYARQIDREYAHSLPDGAA